MNTKPQLRFPHAVVFAVVIQALLVVSAKAQTVAVDRVLLEQLQSVIEQQQEQLKKQSEQLDTQMETIQALKSRVDQLEEKSSETETIATQAQSTAEQAIDTAQNSAGKGASDNVVTSGSEKVKLAVSGQINRAVNVADDGNKTKSYFVDNNVSNTRVRFVGTGKIDEDTTLGTTVEIALSSNNSFDVSQDDENPSDFIDVRKAEAFARNDSYGQLALGKGQAAADDTAEYDLSLVGGPIMYSGVSDIVGGLQFTSDGALTGIVVSDAFFNLDGKRQDRIRYDSPLFGPGLQFSGSAGSSDSYDLAATWGGDYGDWTGVDVGSVTTLGAASVRFIDDSNVDYRLVGSFSALHNPSGISVTLSGGTEARDDDRDDPYNLYGKLAWDTSIFSFGQTGFGADITYSEHFTGDDDEGTSYGLAAVQLIENAGTELYLQIRLFDLDRNAGADVDDVTVGTFGVRSKF
jgi:hypothetical protein